MPTTAKTFLAPLAREIQNDQKKVDFSHRRWEKYDNSISATASVRNFLNSISKSLPKELRAFFPSPEELIKRVEAVVKSVGEH